MAEPNVLWRPLSWPQSEALASTEDETFYGGAKGGAKSEICVIRPLRQVHLPAYRALLLRESYDELEELLSRARKYYSRLPSKPHWHGDWMEWRFPNPNTRSGAGGAYVKFGYCRSMEHVERYQGREWSDINFDEAANVAEIRSIWPGLAKEIRSPDPNVLCGIFGTGNPSYAGHSFFKAHFVDPCGASGGTVTTPYTLEDGRVVNRTRRFIPAKISDNPIYANDARYLATLMALPKERRDALLGGLWNTGVGLALPQLEESVHMVKPFKVPRYWKIIGGFDWGYAHKWVFGYGAVTEDGDVIGLDTLRNRGMLAHEIAEEIHRKVPAEMLARMEYVAAGHDCWKVEGRGDRTPVVAEALVAAGLPLVRANQDRVHGLNNFRDYTAWREQGPLGQDIEPALRWQVTDGNVWAFQQCQTIVTDPDDPEKPLKVDVDPETGEGGDDGFDMWRYLIASRPPKARALAIEEDVKPWKPSTLKHEAEESRRVRNPPVVDPRNRPDPLTAGDYAE